MPCPPTSPLSPLCSYTRETDPTLSKTTWYLQDVTMQDSRYSTPRRMQYGHNKIGPVQWRDKKANARQLVSPIFPVLGSLDTPRKYDTDVRQLFLVSINYRLIRINYADTINTHGLKQRRGNRSSDPSCRPLRGTTNYLGVSITPVNRLNRPMAQGS